MLQILALLLGLASWGLLIYVVIKKQKLSKQKMGVFQTISWLFCAVSIYIPSLCQHLEFKANDYDSVIDCASTYHLASATVLVVTFVLYIITVTISKNER